MLDYSLSQGHAEKVLNSSHEIVVFIQDNFRDNKKKTNHYRNVGWDMTPFFD